MYYQGNIVEMFLYHNTHNHVGLLAQNAYIMTQNTVFSDKKLITQLIQS